MNAKIGWLVSEDGCVTFYKENELPDWHRSHAVRIVYFEVERGEP